jgi:hypothetical protein
MGNTELTYEELRSLFREIARYDGRLSLLSATQTTPLDPGDPRQHSEGTLFFTATIRDHVYQDVFPAYDLQDLARHEDLLALRKKEPAAPPPPTDATAPGATLTWREVLEVLTAVETRPGWTLRLIRATFEVDPRYRVAVCSPDGAIHDLLTTQDLMVFSGE